jgi:putative addiction module CopG family antidote
MQIDLPPDITEFVAQEVSAGHYKSAQDMIVELLRLEREERESTIADIRLGWESAQRGEGTEIAEVARELREEFGFQRRP